MDGCIGWMDGLMDGSMDGMMDGSKGRYPEVGPDMDPLTSIFLPLEKKAAITKRDVQTPLFTWVTITERRGCYPSFQCAFYRQPEKGCKKKKNNPRPRREGGDGDHAHTRAPARMHDGHPPHLAIN